MGITKNNEQQENPFNLPTSLPKDTAIVHGFPSPALTELGSIVRPMLSKYAKGGLSIDYVTNDLTGGFLRVVYQKFKDCPELRIPVTSMETTKIALQILDSTLAAMEVEGHDSILDLTKGALASKLHLGEVGGIQYLYIDYPYVTNNN